MNRGPRVSLLHWDPPLATDSMVVFKPLIKRFQEKGNNYEITIKTCTDPLPCD